jgi:hypothetical protein
MRIRMITVLSPLWFALSACAGRPATPGAATGVRDSAGIAIVENRSPSWTAATAWRLSDSPALRMGVMGGDSAHEFYGIAGVVRLSSGTLVVANSGTHQLRYYDATGRLVSTAGRQGDGPGEFQGLTSLLRLPDDTLGAIDARHRRLSMFGPGGQFVRDVALGGEDPFPVLAWSVEGQLGDGTFLATAPNVRLGPDLMSRPTGAARDSLWVFHLDGSGSVADSIGLFPGRRVTVRMIKMGVASAPLGIPVTFSSTTQVAAGTGLVFIGVSDRYEIGAYTPSGQLRRLIRRDWKPRPVTDADRERWRQRLQEQRLPSGSAQIRQMMQPMFDAMANPDFAETMPAFRRLLVDAERDLWVSSDQGSDSTGQHLTVFDPEGRLLGTVVLPQRLAVTEIGADYVLGHTTDETGVEHVELYALIKPAG